MKQYLLENKNEFVQYSTEKLIQMQCHSRYPGTLPLGERILFRVLRPLTSRVRRTGLGVFRRPKYRAKTLNKTTPADIDNKTTWKVRRKKQRNH